MSTTERKANWFCSQCDEAEALFFCPYEDCPGSQGFCDECAPESDMPFSGSIGGRSCPFCERELLEE